MKFKLDENFDPRLAALFEPSGHQAESVSAEGLSGASDEALYEVCQSEERCLVTLDLDFANPLRFPPGITGGIVVLRVARPTLHAIRTTVATLLIQLEQRPVKGRLWIVEPGRIREYDS